MRIGIDCRLPTYQMGGISQSILHLLPALATQDTSNKYLLYHSRNERGTFIPENGSQFRRRTVWTPPHHSWERWTLAAEIMKDRLDVLHSPDFIPPAAGAKKRVVTIHDLNFIYFPELLTEESKRYYLDQIEWAVRSADSIAADSEKTRQDLMELLDVPGEKVKTIYLAANPLYQEAFPVSDVTNTIRRYGLGRGFVLFVGTLEPRKNLPMLIKAYAGLREKWGVDVPLVLVGRKGWLYEETFQTIDAYGLQDHVHHLSGVFDEGLAHLYHAAGVLVTPSHYEGFGLPALEAQHCGCPVIVSNRGSLPEIVGERGMMLEPDDLEGWAEAMWRVLTNEELREVMIKMGKLQARQFSWEKTAKQTLSLYEGM